ncbi:MAG: hypothetical protein J6V44_01390, partial [Methanobrevibacter sp.]|nr:hypothetical protein [Methanobrevibacter sp.]
MNLLEQAQHFLESKGFIVEGRTEAQELGYIQNVLGFMDAESANVMYYIGRLITNKGPQTEGSIEKYLNSKFGNTIPDVNLVEDEENDQRSLTWQEFLYDFFKQVGRKYDFTTESQEMWNRAAKWHESNAESEDPNAKYVKQFFDWYNDKKKGNETNPPKDLIKFVNGTEAEDVEKAFGKYYKFALTQLDKYLEGGAGLSEEETLIKEFWDWHRAKKNGKPYPMPENVITGMIKFLKTPKALEVMQQYYYYAVRVIEKLADTVIKTPVNLTGLRKELQRIMDNLDNDKYVDELEKIEINRLHGGDMTAGPVFVLPTSVIKSIRTMAKDTKNIDSSKVGKVDKSQVKECYVYCTNELNRKFHIGRTGIFDLNIQDFYDTYKIVFTRGFNTKTLHKIFDDVCQYLLDQLDKGTAEYWKNRGKIDVDDVEDFNEAYKALKAAGYVIVEDTIDDVLQHGLSPFDKARLNKGQKPSWAAIVTEIGPRTARPKRSQDWTERAMDSVTGIKKPYSESDWRRDNELNLKGNQQIEQRLKAILNVSAKVEATKDYVGVYTQDKAF